MSIIETKDYVLAPKATLIAGGVVYGMCLGTKKYLFFIPISKLEGAGDYVTTTKYQIGGQSITDGLQAILANSETTIADLEAKLLSLFNDWSLNKDEYAMEIAALSEFEIKTGLFSSGIYYKTPNQKRRSALSIGGKSTLVDFKNFYGR